MNKVFSITHKKQGFTLIEATVAMFAFAIISLGLVALVSGLLTDSGRQSVVLADTDQARKTAFNVINELRRAQSGSNGAYSLEAANDQEIVYFSNVDSDLNIERVRYFVQNGKLKKGVTKYSGTTYNTSTEQTITAQNNLAILGTPLFYYYDGTYNGSTTQASLTQPVNVTQVKYVKVVLPIYNKAGQLGLTPFLVTASGAIRNLKTNLGN